MTGGLIGGRLESLGDWTTADVYKECLIFHHHSLATSLRICQSSSGYGILAMPRGVGGRTKSFEVFLTQELEALAILMGVQNVSAL